MSLVPPNANIENMSRDELLYLLPEFDFGLGQLLAPRVYTKNLKLILNDRKNTQYIATYEPSKKEAQTSYLNSVINKYLNRKNVYNKILFLATDGKGGITQEESAELQAQMNEEGSFKPMFEEMGIEVDEDTDFKDFIKTTAGKFFLYVFRVVGYDILNMKSDAYIAEYENQKNYLNDGVTILKVLPPNFIENINKYKEGLTPSIWSLYPEQRDKYLRQKKIERGVQTVGTFSLLASIATIFLAKR